MILVFLKWGKKKKKKHLKGFRVPLTLQKSVKYYFGIY